MVFTALCSFEYIIKHTGVRVWVIYSIICLAKKKEKKRNWQNRIVQLFRHMSLSLACAHAFRQRKNIKLFYYMCSVYSMYMYIYVYCIIHDTRTVTEIRSLFSLASNTHERWSFSFSILFHVEIIKKMYTVGCSAPHYTFMMIESHTFYFWIFLTITQICVRFKVVLGYRSTHW